VMSAVGEQKLSLRRAREKSSRTDPAARGPEIHVPRAPPSAPDAGPDVWVACFHGEAVADLSRAELDLETGKAAVYGSPVVRLQVADLRRSGALGALAKLFVQGAAVVISHCFLPSETKHATTCRAQRGLEYS